MTTVALSRVLAVPGIRVVGTALFALVFRSGVRLALWVAVATVLLWRIRDEEALMRDELGDEWVVCTRRSWRLVPGVY